jgi:hypothetical protein
LSNLNGAVCGTVIDHYHFIYSFMQAGETSLNGARRIPNEYRLGIVVSSLLIQKRVDLPFTLSRGRKASS